MKSKVKINKCLFALNMQNGTPNIHFQGKNSDSVFMNNCALTMKVEEDEKFQLDVIDGVVTLVMEGYAVVPKSFLTEDQLKQIDSRES